MCAIVARLFNQFSLRLVPEDIDLERARSAGHSPAWVEQRTKERAADALLRVWVSVMGFIPSLIFPIEMIPRCDKSPTGWVQ